MLRATAEEAMTQTGFVFDEATGMYYDQSTGFYYDSVCEADFHTVAEVIFQLHGFKMNKCDAPVFFIQLFLVFHSSVSCTTMATRAFTTTMMQRVADTSFIPRSRSRLLLWRTRTLVIRRAESLRNG